MAESITVLLVDDHSLVRSGKLVANIEGNRFTPEQLTDLVKSVISR